MTRLETWLAHCIAQATRPHTEADQRAAAAALGVSDHLPEPQERLPLEHAAA